VSVSPLFDGMILPRAEQTILGGSWDHRRERLSRSPNRRLYPVLLRQALAAGAADGAALEGLLGSLANQIKDGIAEELAGNEILREIEQTRQELEDRVRQAEKKLDEVKQQVQEEVAAIVRRFEEARDRARLAVQAIDRELEALEQRIKEHAAVEPKDGDHQAETGRLERQLEDRRRAGREAVEQLRRLESLLEKARSATGL
jgi:chromosome segregation ATPase